ncbi:MAG: hypothetical protein K8I03_02240 [Ignavibacteria bacterium]|nr:hypothetical protein [Ignavibacteria bacterium]
MTPADIIDKTIRTPYKNPVRVNGIFYGILLRLIALGIFIMILWKLFESPLFPKLRSVLNTLLRQISGFVGIKLLFVITLVYVITLLAAAVISYDVGTDEAWYICVGENFTKTLIPYLTSNGKIFIIDNISMLPYYTACFINFGFGFTEIWHFKLIAALLSLGTLFVLYKVSSKQYGKDAAVIFFFFLVIQPGFGFVASSFFGELLQSAFVFYGLFLWLKSPVTPGTRRIVLVSLLFTLAIHTKFQLMFIIPLVLLVMHFTDRETNSLRLLLYTLLFSVLLLIARSVPVAFKDISVLRYLVVINLFTEQSVNSSLTTVFDKLQLLNRFFPASLFVLISFGFSFYCMKTAFDRFIFSFSTVTILWWVFMYPFSPYRVPFMGFIMLALMAAVMLRKAYITYVHDFPNHKVILKYAVAFSLLFLMLYGFSANFVYALAGYNDGVQFDLDGFKSRQFTGAGHNGSQKEFYEDLKKVVPPVDTLYNGSSTTMLYTENPVSRLDMLQRSLESSSKEKFVLFVRDMYPFGFDEISSQLDSIGGTRRLIIKKPGHELYGILK